MNKDIQFKIIKRPSATSLEQALNEWINENPDRFIRKTHMPTENIVLIQHEHNNKIEEE
jgi:protease II